MILLLSNLLLLLSFCTHKHTSITSRVILLIFFGRRVNSKPPAIPFGIVACTFSDNLSRNSCIESAAKQAGTLSSQRHFPPFPETVDTTCFKKRKIKPFHSYSLLLKLSVRNRKKKPTLAEREGGRSPEGFLF